MAKVVYDLIANLHRNLICNKRKWTKFNLWMYPIEMKDKLVQLENIKWKFEIGKVYAIEKSIRDNLIIYNMII